MRNMKSYIYVLTAAFSGTFSLNPAFATIPPAQLSDVRCLLLSNVFAKSAKEPKAQQAAYVAHFFYLGRVRVAVASTNLQEAISNAAKSIVPAHAGEAMQACVAEIGAAEADATRAGKLSQPPSGK